MAAGRPTSTRQQPAHADRNYDSVCYHLHDSLPMTSPEATQAQSMQPEQVVVEILRRLPPDRKQQVVDFARFMESEAQKVGELLREESEEQIAAENTAWDALLETDEAQALLDKLADEALAEIKAGSARSVIFTEDGEIAPE